MKSLAIILLCIVAAIVYGVALHQVTARICVEYLTIRRPVFFATRSPTLLALGWGVIGLIVGVPLALVARAGNLPKLTVTSLVMSVARVFLIMACCALLAGILGFVLVKNNEIHLLEPAASHILKNRHPLFMADLGAHLASYLAGLIGGVALIGVTWKRRRAGRP
jgi:amino acid permease